MTLVLHRQAVLSPPRMPRSLPPTYKLTYSASNLESALSELSAANVDVRIKWKPFLLNISCPKPVGIPYAEYFLNKYGMSAAQMEPGTTLLTLTLVHH